MLNKSYNHVLLADDDFDDCDIFSEVFSAQFPDIKLSISNDGGMLMDHLNRPPDPTADLIFLDLNMPGLTGFQCLAQIREDANLKNNIIIIFTTSSNTDGIEKLYAMGANYFITKPTDYSDMEKLINKALALIQVSGTAQPAFQDFYIRA